MDVGSPDSPAFFQYVCHGGCISSWTATQNGVPGCMLFDSETSVALTWPPGLSACSGVNGRNSARKRRSFRVIVVRFMGSISSLSFLCQHIYICLRPRKGYTL